MIRKRVTTKDSTRTVTRRIKEGNDAFRDTDTGTESYADTDASVAEKKEESGHMITCTSPVNVRDAASSQSHVIGELAKGRPGGKNW